MFMLVPPAPSDTSQIVEFGGYNIWGAVIFSVSDLLISKELSVRAFVLCLFKVAGYLLVSYLIVERVHVGVL